jgi:hypothetical protein
MPLVVGEEVCGLCGEGALEDGLILFGEAHPVGKGGQVIVADVDWGEEFGELLMLAGSREVPSRLGRRVNGSNQNDVCE